MAENRVIGRSGTLPWHLPNDMRRFRTLTTGHAVIMGRKTYDTLDGPLAHRRNIVLTRDPTYRRAGIEVARSLDGALALAAGDPEVFVAGGGEVYRLALPRADRMYLTVVHATVDGDTLFPDFDLASWQLEEDLRYAPDERHALPYSFRLYTRRATAN